VNTEPSRPDTDLDIRSLARENRWLELPEHAWLPEPEATA
jgi:hypothetical protein